MPTVICLNEKKIKNASSTYNDRENSGPRQGIREHGTALQGKKITAGFDGFIDTIVKVIKKKGR